MKQVLVLSMGGTLGMGALSDGTLKPHRVLNDLFNWMPELKGYAEINLEILENIDSSLMVPSHWLKLAQRIAVAQNNGECHGIVVLHGTDTLAYTASALSFLLLGINMPIVLTGAQKPLAVTRTDARNNILGAVETAIEGPSEVLIFFHHTAYRGNRSSKVAIGEFDGFDSPNYPHLGRAGISWFWNTPMFWSEASRPAMPWPLPQSLPDPPLVLPWLPGFDPTHLAPVLNRYWAVIFEAFGAGNFPLDGPTRAMLSAYHDSGGLFFLRSQVMRGATDLGAYEPGKAARELGFIGGLDLTREAMVTKLMVLKALGLDSEEIKRYLVKSLAGELTQTN